MLAIRLTRTGKKNAPHYRIVVQEKRSKLNGKSVDIIGHYHPATIGKELVIDAEKAQKWLGLGAQPSDTVTNLFVKQGVLDATRKVKHFYTAAPKEEAPAKEEPAAAEVATEETPVAEGAFADKGVTEELAIGTAEEAAGVSPTNPPATDPTEETAD